MTSKDITRFVELYLTLEQRGIIKIESEKEMSRISVKKSVSEQQDEAMLAEITKLLHLATGLSIDPEGKSIMINYSGCLNCSRDLVSDEFVVKLSEIGIKQIIIAVSKGSHRIISNDEAASFNQIKIIRNSLDKIAQLPDDLKDDLKKRIEELENERKELRSKLRLTLTDDDLRGCKPLFPVDGIRFIYMDE